MTTIPEETIRVPLTALRAVIDAAECEAQRRAGRAWIDLASRTDTDLLEDALDLARQSQNGAIGINASAILRHAASRTLAIMREAFAMDGLGEDDMRRLEAAIVYFPFTLKRREARAA